MGLLTIIRKNRRREKEMRVLFLGLDNAGKTTILKKLNGEDITDVSPTLGFNIKTFVHGHYTLNIWDVGGQRTLRPYWRNYFEQTDALVWVQELHSLLLEDRLAGASLLVFANKQDIQGSMTDKEIEQASLGIKSHQWSIVSCSAVTGHNLLEGLNWVVGEVASRLYYSTLTGGTSLPLPEKSRTVS
ncbi:GTP-binding protein [Lactarius indigo]|nr:GTP-binding protein [Lactarius indigo]